MSSVSPTHQDLSNDTTFSQFKSRVPVPLIGVHWYPYMPWFMSSSQKMGSSKKLFCNLRNGYQEVVHIFMDISAKRKIFSKIFSRIYFWLPGNNNWKSGKLILDYPISNHNPMYLQIVHSLFLYLYSFVKFL